jgi:putative DNA primase/helicase
MSTADDEVITELARLDALAYARRQKDAAKALGITIAELRKIVDKKRRAIKPDADNGQGRTVKIVDPLPWHEPVSGDRIATTLAAAIKTYVVLSDEAADAIAMWTLHSWAVNAFVMSPRLAIVSPTKGCGKTTVLRVLNYIARRPKRTGSISPAALFRVIEKFQPTILLDETEKYIENGSDNHALLNEGHCKGGTVTRVIGDSLELREFSIYGAVAYARNGRLPDDLEQRSIVIEMQRRRATENLARLRDDRAESLKQIAQMCSRWAADNAGLLPDQDPDMEMINRNADNWRPLFAIADLCGEDWPQRIRQAAAALGPRESETYGTMLLADIRGVFDEKQTDRMASGDMADALASIEGRPWAEWKASKNASPKPLSKNQLAGLLKPFHIISDSVRIGERTPKGYYRSQF